MVSAIGLDIGSSAVRAVQLSRGRGKQARIQRLGQVTLAPGTVANAEPVEPEGITQALQVLWREFGFKSRRVALGLAHSQVVVRRVDLPSMPVDGLRESLLMQAQDYLPLPLDQAEFDYHLMEEYQDEGGTWMMRILLIAAESAMVRRYLDVVEDAKLKPMLLDLDAFAQMRAFRDPVVTEKRFGVGSGELIIDIGAQLTNITVHTNGTPRFVRLLPMGADSITQPLTEAGLDWGQAQTVQSADPEDWPQYAQVLGDSLAELIAEIRQSVDYYRGQNGSVDIDNVVLTGGGSMVPRLDEHFAVALDVPVAHGDPFQSLETEGLGMSAEELDGAKPFMAAAVGLALGALK